MKILKSLSNDPVRNMSLERKLLTERDEDFLLLYINSPSVIIGRNQSPEAEADMEYCRRCGIPVIRRISGGGAVYHDHGNINWSFITVRGDTPPLDDKQHAPIASALAETGIEATVGSRGELRAGGLKISGTASYVTSTRRMFHGTLLFDTDMERMRLALAGNPDARGKKVASVASETVNLKHFLPQFGSAADFMEKIAVIIARYFNACEPENICL